MHIIGGIYKNRILTAPKGALTRPSSSKLRESFFNICQTLLEDANFLDLFAGSGAMGLEALSRGARQSTLVDSSKESARCIVKNIQTLKVEKQAVLLCADVFTTLKKLSKSGAKFDVIFADPPYEKKGLFNGQIATYSWQLLQLVDSEALLREGGYLFLEDVLPEDETHAFFKELKTLELVSLRKFGKTSLCEFKKLPLKSQANG